MKDASADLVEGTQLFDCGLFERAATLAEQAATSAAPDDPALLQAVVLRVASLLWLCRGRDASRVLEHAKEAWSDVTPTRVRLRLDAVHRLVEMCDALLSDFAGRSLEAFPDDIRWVLWVKFEAWEWAEDMERLAEVVSELSARFSDANVPGRRDAVARAMARYADGWERKGEHERALVAFTEVYDRFHADPPIGERFVAMDAAFMVYSELYALKRFEEAIDACDRLLERYWPEADLPYVAGTIAETLLGKALALAELGRRRDALAPLDLLVETGSISPHPAVRKFAMQARAVKIYHLVLMGAITEACEVGAAVMPPFEAETDLDTMLAMGESLLEAANLLEPRTRRFLEKWRSPMQKAGGRQAVDILDAVIKKLEQQNDHRFVDLLSRAERDRAEQLIRKGSFVRGIRGLERTMEGKSERRTRR